MMATDAAGDVWSRITLVRGDITMQRVDAIVNAANAALAGGGGVDGAIHRAAGGELMQACNRLGGCPTGSAKITPGYNLPAKYVIHAVGPVYRDGCHGEPDQLAACYRAAVALASQHQCETVAFSAISCGVYGYPHEAAARVSLAAVAESLVNRTMPRSVRWVLFDDHLCEIFSTVRVELMSQKSDEWL